MLVKDISAEFPFLFLVFFYCPSFVDPQAPFLPTYIPHYRKWLLYPPPTLAAAIDFTLRFCPLPFTYTFIFTKENYRILYWTLRTITKPCPVLSPFPSSPHSYPDCQFWHAVVWFMNNSNAWQIQTTTFICFFLVVFSIILFRFAFFFIFLFFTSFLSFFACLFRFLMIFSSSFSLFLSASFLLPFLFSFHYFLLRFTSFLFFFFYLLLIFFLFL